MITQTENIANAMVIKHYYVPETQWNYYILEEKELKNDNKSFFALVHGDEIEFGYVTLFEMFHYFGMLPVVRNLGWKPKTLLELGLVREDGRRTNNRIKHNLENGDE